MDVRGFDYLFILMVDTICLLIAIYYQSEDPLASSFSKKLICVSVDMDVYDDHLKSYLFIYFWERKVIYFNGGHTI